MEDELFTVVNWKLKLLDDETPPVWHAGDATRYAEHTNMIHVSIDAVGEGEEELCFEYMRLESCDATKNSASSLALFERLLQKQRAWVEADGAREPHRRAAAVGRGGELVANIAGLVYRSVEPVGGAVGSSAKP